MFNVTLLCNASGIFVRIVPRKYMGEKAEKKKTGNAHWQPKKLGTAESSKDSRPFPSVASSGPANLGMGLR